MNSQQKFYEDQEAEVKGIVISKTIEILHSGNKQVYTFKDQKEYKDTIKNLDSVIGGHGVSMTFEAAIGPFMQKAKICLTKGFLLNACVIMPDEYEIN